MEKENQKCRDVAKKAFNILIQNLVRFVRKRDPRIIKIEAEKTRRLQEEEQKRIAFR